MSGASHDDTVDLIAVRWHHVRFIASQRILSHMTDRDWIYEYIYI